MEASGAELQPEVGLELQEQLVNRVSCEVSELEDDPDSVVLEGTPLLDADLRIDKNGLKLRSGHLIRLLDKRQIINLQAAITLILVIGGRLGILLECLHRALQVRKIVENSVLEHHLLRPGLGMQLLVFGGQIVFYAGEFVDCLDVVVLHLFWSLGGSLFFRFGP